MIQTVSSSFPSLFHIFPPPLTKAAIEASTIISEGTWKLVIPLSEFTIATLGPFAKAVSISALISASWAFPFILSKRSAKPLFGFISKDLKVSAYLVKTSLKKVSTIAPKTIGSEIFIIVAFRWAERSTFLFLASSIASWTKDFKEFKFITEESITSPAWRPAKSFNKVSAPSFPLKTILYFVAFSRVVEVSVP